MSGGEIKVESEVGKGTTFRIFLPLGSEHLRDEELDTSHQSSVIRHQSDQMVIENDEMKFSIIHEKEGVALMLIVEDNPDMRYYIRSYFEKDFHVIEAGNGREGILLAREHLPDIIVSDVMMPVMDGIEFCRKIKSGDLTSHIPIILLTAKASKEDRLEGLETGADDFITKPFDGEELIVRVNNLVAQRNLLKEKFSRVFEQSRDMASTARLSSDQQFLQKAIDIVEKHLSDPDFSVHQFSGEMALSRVQLHRKLTAIVNRNATDFIRIYRLNKAADMIFRKEATIAEIAYDVGFSSPSYFTHCFKKQYGMNPSEYADKAM